MKSINANDFVVEKVIKTLSKEYRVKHPKADKPEKDETSDTKDKVETEENDHTNLS